MTTARDKNLTETIMNNVRAARTRLKMSAQDLADRCEQLGVPISRSTIGNLESGRRNGITVTELMTFADALETPALFLIHADRTREDSAAREKFGGWMHAHDETRDKVRHVIATLNAAADELEKYR